MIPPLWLNPSGWLSGEKIGATSDRVEPTEAPQGPWVLGYCPIDPSKRVMIDPPTPLNGGPLYIKGWVEPILRLQDHNVYVRGGSPFRVPLYRAYD